MSLPQGHPARAGAGSQKAALGAPAATGRILAAQAALAALLIAPLVMNPAGARMFEASKLVALAPLAALMAAGLLFPGRASSRNPAAASTTRPALWALAAFFACALVSTLASNTPWIALFGNYFRREGLAAWAVGGLALLALYRAPPGGAMRAIDVLLLASAAPCAYALAQRFGLVEGIGGPLARPGGSLGNPVFLGDFLMLLLPLAAGRCIALRAACAAWRPCAPWLLLAGLQAVTLLVTESRAPIGAALAALWLFAVLAAGLTGSRRLLAAAAGLMAGAVLLLAAINLVPPATRLAQEVPGLKRFVLDAGDLSGASRGGIWQAGLGALRAAPPERLALGYGLDAAHYAYYAHLPARVLQIEGETDVTDRLHNEPMELAASVGLAGLAAYLLFLGALLRAARAGLWPEDAAAARRSLVVFALAPLACGLAGGLVCALLPGAAALAGVGFGLGAGAAWVLLLALRAWRAMRGNAAVPRIVSAREWMIAALACALLGFWLDAQLSLPVMSTRLVFFAACGLLLALLREAALPVEQGVEEGADMDALRGGYRWEAGIVLAAAMVAFIPAPFSGLDAYRPFSGVAGWVVVLGLPLLAVWGLGRVTPGTSPHQVAFACALVLLPGAAGYVGLSGLLLALAAPDEWAVAAPVLWVWTWIAIACSLRARAFGRHAVVPVVPVAESPPPKARQERRQKRGDVAPAAVPARGRMSWGLVAASIVLAGAALWIASVELRADVLIRLAAPDYREGRYEQALARVARAASLLPGEAHYQATLGTRRLERVAAQLAVLRNADARQFLFLGDELREAEARMRRALALTPDDPRTVLQLGNVLQFEAKVGMRPIMGEQFGAAKAREARALFEEAHRRYPAQSVILHHWAQLEFDGGNAAAAYGLLDRMEGLEPASEAPYVERMRMARFAGDAALYQATLARARQSLAPEALERLEREVAGFAPPR